MIPLRTTKRIRLTFTASNSQIANKTRFAKQKDWRRGGGL